MMSKYYSITACFFLLFLLVFFYAGERQAEAAASEEIPVKVVTSSDPDEGATLVLSNQKHVWAWGDSGFTGKGSQYGGALPARVRFHYANGTEMTDPMKDVGAGNEHFAALTETGTVWTWGKNFYGMLGDGTTTDKYAPVQVVDDTNAVLTDVKDIAVGTYHTLALKNDGSVWAWGANSRGQLGIGNTAAQNKAVKVDALSNIVEIAAGESIWIWMPGRCEGRYVGNRSPMKLRSTPIPCFG